MSMQKLENKLSIWDDESYHKEMKSIVTKDCKGNISDLEFKTFVGIGKETGLNPFTREIWIVKYSDNAPASIFIGRDGYRKAAQMHPLYDFHYSESIYEKDEFYVQNGKVYHKFNMLDRGKLLGGYCVAKRKGSEKEIYNIVQLKEYDTGKSNWQKMPETMIKKVAEAQTLRLAFQDMFSGTYSEEELETIKNNGSQTVQKQTIDISEFTEIKAQNENNSDKDEMINAINNIIIEKNLSEERYKKALKFFGVQFINDMDLEQLGRFLDMLLKIK